ncbi:hypothetical protein GCM10009801_00910 [Streptomyces albiaxialis]|uniref:Uncharacterized protein n=1 Tax=Streptomyces albiaxialis TaxID=329523 RepID=A0ABN2VEB2_9ACTN
MPDTTPLITAADRLADRLRALPQSALRRGAAAEGLALARELVLRAQRLEAPGEVPRVLPDAGLFATGDQLAVAANDFVEALALAPPAEREDHLKEALALVRAAAQRIG